jgi:predicted  nucleic acid-binding Zn-ribbon protein
VKGNLQQLITLQEADLRLEELALKKRRLPEMVEAARQPLQAAQTQRDTLKKEFDLAVKERKTREQDLAAQEQTISKLDDRALKGEIKTNKEFQAHKFEVDLAKKKKGEIEEQLLILMDQVDAMKKELTRLEEAAKTADQRFTMEKSALEASVGALDGELAELTRTRKEIAGAVEPSLVRKYEKLRATRKGVALAAVSKEGSCMACRLHVEPQIVAEVKRADNILTCSYCQRILYWTGGQAQPPAEPERSSEEVAAQETGRLRSR